MSASSGRAVYGEFIRRTIIVLLLLFMVGALCAAVFAYWFTKPIKNIARDTRRMSDLEFVPPPVARRDEIGQLVKDVYLLTETHTGQKALASSFRALILSPPRLRWKTSFCL